VDFKLIENLIKEMNKSNLTALELEENGLKIRMEKKHESNNVVMNQEVKSSIAQDSNQMINQEVKLVQTAPQAETIEGDEILSPMVGTFYESQSPEHPPFIKIGDKVKKGQTLCIIEAMKLMNEIESDVDGEVVNILTRNEEMVEFNQPLFLIKQ